MWVEANSGSGGGGGGETETTLWTNPSPTSSFSSQTITLSDNYTNYKKIAFYFNVTTGTQEGCKIEYMKENVDAMDTRISGNRLAGGLCAFSTYLYFRGFSSDSLNLNQISLFNTYRTASTGSQNSYCIPTKVTGIN